MTLMRTPCKMTISLSPKIAEELERVRKEENRTRTELVCEALHTYFSFLRKFPEVPASKADLAVIRRGREAFARGEYVTLDQVLRGSSTARRRLVRVRP